MNKFKIGDKVILISSPNGTKESTAVGEEFLVTDIDSDDDDLCYKIRNSASVIGYWVSENQIKFTHYDED